MTKRKIFEYGGMLAGVVLIAFGIGALLMSFDARSTVSDELKREQIVGSPDMSPTAIQQGIDEAGLTGVEAPSCDVADEPIETGAEARCFSQYMRIHALESSGGLTYARDGPLPRSRRSGEPGRHERRGGGAHGRRGQPGPNAARNTWVTETSLSTALNLSYMAEQLALFGIVVGVRADAHRHRLPGARHRWRAAPRGGRSPDSREGGARIVAASPVGSAEPPSPGGSAFLPTPLRPRGASVDRVHPEA